MRKLLKEIAREDAIYFAGLFDGEGCVGLWERDIKHSGIGRKTPYFSIDLSVSNTNVEVLEHIRRTIGGSLGTSNSYKLMKNGKPRRKLHRWAAQSNESYHILKAAAPFLIVKREQALLAMEFHETTRAFLNLPHPGVYGKLPISDAEVQRRRSYVQRMKAMKQATYAPATVTAPLS